MTTLNQLIEQRCPDGVEYVRLGDVFELKNGYTPSRKRADFWQSGTVPWFRMDDIRRNGRVLGDSVEHVTESAIKGGKLFPANSVILATSATIGEHALITAKFMCNQRFTVLQPREEHITNLNPKFTFYVGFELGEYCLENVNEGNFKSVSMPSLREFMFPLPPREVQDKVVEYLDTFAALCENLDTDIAQREKQFAGYRETLLTRPDSTAVALKLGDFLHMRAGKNIKAAEISPEPNDDRCTPCIGGNGLRGYVNRVTHNGDSPVVGRQGALCGNVSWVSGDFYATEHAIVVTPDESATVPRYSYHLLTLMNLNQYASKSAQPGLSVSALKKLSAELPCLETQQEIADKLDAMEELINNLRLEREQRQQQFNYYREKLLSFPKKNTPEV